MRGHIICEERFLHQGSDHHLFVTQADGAMHEYRFEVRRLVPGNDEPETVFEKTEDFSEAIQNKPSTANELIQAELEAIKQAVTAEEKIHAHDP